MKYLGLALYAEGPTDYEFLCQLPLRLCEDIAARSSYPVELSEVLRLDHPAEAGSLPREKRIVPAARAAAGQWTVLFVHADGAGDSDRTRREQIDPALTGLLSGVAVSGRGCAVLPVRETEAWALADPKAFGGAIAHRVATVVPASARAVERLPDPKRTLHEAARAIRPRAARRRSKHVGPSLGDLGRRVSLDRLREVPSWQHLERELEGVLRVLRIL